MCFKWPAPWVVQGAQPHYQHPYQGMPAPRCPLWLPRPGGPALTLALRYESCLFPALVQGLRRRAVSAVGLLGSRGSLKTHLLAVLHGHWHMLSVGCDEQGWGMAQHNSLEF